jgi:RHS repeat-associated protein
VYDAGDERALKSWTDENGVERHAAYIFDSLELRGATFASGEFERTASTEVGYLSAHGVRLARLAYEKPAAPSIGGGRLHVFLELSDHLGSTNIVIDQATSELVERSTYQAYGGAESDYRPERWQAFREDYRFTGKEEDVELGLQYFGKRFYSTALARWMSPDPLAVHEPGEADLNLYAYVRGNTLAMVDPSGLIEDTADARDFLGDKRLRGTNRSGIPDAEVGISAKDNPLNRPSVRAKLGVQGPVGGTDFDHTTPVRKIFENPDFWKLTGEQQVRVLRNSANLGELDSYVNQYIKNGKTIEEVIQKYKITGRDAKALREFAAKSEAAIRAQIKSYTAENAGLTTENIRAIDGVFLAKKFPKNSVVARIAARIGRLPNGILTSRLPVIESPGSPSPKAPAVVRTGRIRGGRLGTYGNLLWFAFDLRNYLKYGSFSPSDGS